MKCLYALAAVLLTAATALAAPNLDDYTDINGVRLYRDQAKPAVFYPAPAPPALAKGPAGLPALSFEVFRYHGRKGTGDSGKFRIRGVLSLDIRRERGKKEVKQLKSALKKTFGIKYPKLRSIPVSATRGRMLFSDISLEWSRPGRWPGKRIILPLDEQMSLILWEALEAGPTLLSVEMTEDLAGVKKTGDGEWGKATGTHAATLPVTLDMSAHPSLYRKTELGGRMAMGYTGIDVLCFDFLEELDPTLYSKIVEVAIPTPGTPLTEAITFKEESAPRQRIDFKLAKDLDTAYRVRITRVYTDGRTEKGDWAKREGEAMLDITDYKITEDDEDEE
ncbi:MAG: hypothetical protein HUN04_11045 [Desulfobacter sp.]|nr:MAG: hypothetical protein HUN04_11045 [Desulfobacter sp.]